MKKFEFVGLPILAYLMIMFVLRIAELREQLDGCISELEELRNARNRQMEMVSRGIKCIWFCAICAVFVRIFMIHIQRDLYL